MSFTASYPTIITNVFPFHLSLLSLSPSFYLYLPLSLSNLSLLFTPYSFFLSLTSTLSATGLDRPSTTYFLLFLLTFSIHLGPAGGVR